MTSSREFSPAVKACVGAVMVAGVVMVGEPNTDNRAAIEQYGDTVVVGEMPWFHRVHADDCVDCDKRKEGWIELVRSQVTIQGTFDDAQRTRLAQVAERCPVHKTLANGVEMFDSVAFEDVAQLRRG